MIRLAFMVDKARVLGASTSEGDAVRLKLLPEGLHGAMQDPLPSENITIGKGSVQFYGSTEMAGNQHIITGTPAESFELFVRKALG